MQTSLRLYTLMGTLLIAVTALAFVALVIWLVFRTVARRHEVLSRERLAALERGVPLPPEAFLEGHIRRPRNTLRTGMVELAVGIGAVIMLVAAKPGSGLWGAGVVVTLLGVANIAYWFIRGRREWEEARAVELELARARAAAMSRRTEGDGGESR